MDLIQNQLGGGLLDLLDKEMIGASREQTNAGAQLTVSTLINALTKNAENAKGLSPLYDALGKNHDGGILNNLSGLISGQLTNNKAADGMGILSHLLGNSNIFNVVEMISKGSGLSRNNTMGMLIKLAPVVLGMLGKKKKQNRMQPQNLQEFLLTSQTSMRESNPQQELLTRFLDKDMDGDIMDDVADMGMKILGGFLK